MQPEHYSERNLALSGWDARLVSYQLDDEWICKIDNVSPGAQVARATGATREDAENTALAKAERRFAATKRHAV